mgnify:CR=1 FL=1
MNIEYGCVVGSWDRYNAYVAPRTAGRRVHTRFGETSIASAYNSILDACTDLDVLILLHDDLEITDPDGEAKLAAAVTDPGVILAGVAGGSGRHGLAWWNHDPVGHQQTDAMSIDFGPRSGDVDLLEGSLLVFGPRAVADLRFDLQYPGFHGYDDIGMQAAQMGRVVVVDVDTHHHTPMGFKTPDSQTQWWAADRLYRDKWQLT